jgi:hypothetical protein
MDAPASTDDRTPKQKVQFYVSAALLISAIFSLSAFLFLIPFVLDPAYALIAAEFIKDPVTCQVNWKIPVISERSSVFTIRLVFFRSSVSASIAASSDISSVFF